MKFTIAYLLFLVVLTNTSFGQGEAIYENLKPASPTASSLATYGEVPISLYAGTPNISIPLYEFSGLELKLPLSLSYNSGGVRVEDIASWVGLGWSLNAGGVITRSIRDKPDRENNTTNMRPIRAELPLKTNTYAETDATFNIVKQTTIFDTDAEPDVFNYNFHGMSGSFIFDNKGQVKFGNYANYKVSLTEPKITIITDDGTKYEFNDREVTNGETTSWFLSKITSASGKEIITFSYAQELSIYQSPIRYSKIVAPSCGEANPQNCGSFLPFTSNEPDNICRTTNINGLRLTNIDFQGLGKAEFVPSLYPRVDFSSTSSAYYLDNIIIKDFANTPIRNFDFETQYVPAKEPYSGIVWASTCPQVANSTYLNYRMYLRALIEKSGNGLEKKQYYQFSYYGRTGIYEETDLLPHRLSAGQDHWGYYNGQNNRDLWPGFCGPFGPSRDNNYNLSASCETTGVKSVGLWTIPQANREPKFPEMMYGSLKSITYPTGGQTKFIYENHVYDYVGSDSPPDRIPYCNPEPIKMAGGLRIKEVISYTDLGQTKAKSTSYSYARGVLKYWPSYYTYFFSNEGTKSLYLNCQQAAAVANFKLFVEINSGTVTDHGYRNGPHIGYETVVEKNYAVVGNNTIYNGCTEYNYRTERFDPSPSSSVETKLCYIFQRAGSPPVYTVSNIPLINENIYPYFPGRNIDWRHGQLLTKFVKNNNNQTVFFQRNNYTNVELSAIPAAKIIRIRQDRDYFFLNYTFIEGWPKLISQNDIVYDLNGNNGISTTKTFEYNSSVHKYLTAQISNNSDGIDTKKSFKYIQDYEDMAMNNYISILKNKNILNKVIDERTTKIDKVIGGMITSYNGNGFPTQIYNLELLQPTPIGFDKNTIIPPNPLGFSSSPFKGRTQINYDDDNRIQSVIKDGFSSVFLWGYNKYFLVAEIKNATISQVNNALGITNTPLNLGFNGLSNAQESTLRTNLSNSLVNTFSYFPLIGVSKIKSPNNIISSFSYDGLGRLESVRDGNNNLVKSYSYNYRNQ
jgi:hypothetical protein